MLTVKFHSLLKKYQVLKGKMWYLLVVVNVDGIHKSFNSNFRVPLRIPSNAKLSILRGYDYTDYFHIEQLNNPMKFNQPHLRTRLGVCVKVAEQKNKI